MHSFDTPKGTKLPLLDLRGKPYLQVAHRIVWFREEHPDWRVTTEAIQLQSDAAIFKATIKDASGNTISEGTKHETKAHFTDFIEKAETGSIGRALALCGYGTQFAPDLDEGSRLADSPIKAAIPKARKSSPQPKGTALPSDSDDGIGLYVLQTGKTKGIMLQNCQEQDLQSYLCWLIAKDSKDGVRGKAKVDMDKLQAFLHPSKKDSQGSPPPANFDGPPLMEFKDVPF